MITLCICGHAKSQHHVLRDGGVNCCDYAGYTCSCLGYKKSTQEDRIAEAVKEFRRRGGTDMAWLQEELQRIKEEKP